MTIVEFKKIVIYVLLLMKMACSARKIIIIGAGASGFAAGCKLLENGFENVTILEAENRIGGRVHSLPFGNGIVDMGAQWCHGEKDNIVYEMVKDLNLVEHSLVNNTHFIFSDSNGEFIDRNATDKLIELCFALADETEEMRKYNGSFGEYMIDRYDEKLNSDFPDTDPVIAKKVFDWFHKIQMNLNAAPTWFDISAVGFSTYKECEGDQGLNWRNKGYKTIFSVLKKEIPDPSKKLPIDDKIIFNKEVSKIIWGNQVKIECSDGSIYEANHVINTIPLAVLKKVYKTMFIPELPLQKKNAIEGLSMGTVNKIWLKFPKRWWPENSIGFDLLWSEEDSKKLITEFPEGPNNDGKSWLESIFGFHPVDDNPNVLLGWINGEFVEEFETMADDVVIRGCMYLLNRFVGRYYTIPQPDEILRSSWSSNKHFLGSYSYRSLESERLHTTHADLAQPLGNNSLLFAGEATHSYFYSTVHGAIETGFREAQRIIDQYRSGS